MRRLAALAGMMSIASAPVPDPARVAALAQAAMAQTGAKQLTIAVVDRGRVASVQAFGSAT